MHAQDEGDFSLSWTRS